MEELTKVIVSLTKDQNYEMSIFLAKLRKVRKDNTDSTKAKEIIRLAMIGLQSENKKL
jgi:hypothetical protein